MDSIPIGLRRLQPNRQLMVDGERISIGPRALSIISVLAQADGEVVTKDELLAAVWPGITVEENALQVHIAAIRKALGEDADRLHTLRGVGYRLETGGPDLSPSELPSEMLALLPAAATGLTPAGGGPADARKVGRKRGFRRVWMAIVVAVLGTVLLGWILQRDPGLASSDARVVLLVRPFSADNQGSTSAAAMASGITDELIVRLRQESQLLVGTDDPSQPVTEGPFADAYLVDGNVRTNGDLLRVTVRLYDPDGAIVWSQTFDRGLADIFEVQEAIAAAISEALGVSLDVGANSAARGGTNNPAAFAAYLKYKATRFNPDQSIPMRYLELALAIDPDYTKALAGVSSSYGIQSNFAATRRQALALLERYDESSARAVATNPGSWIAHAVRGGYHNEMREFSAAAASFQRAQSLDNGTDPELRETLAIYSLLNGRITQAQAILELNEAIDPITRQSPLRMWVLLDQGRYQETILFHDRLSATNLRDRFPFTDTVFWSYLLLRRENEALRFAEQHDVPWSAFLTEFRANPTLPTLSPAQLREWANRTYGDSGHYQLANMAMLASYDNRPGLALDLLRLAFERPGGYGIGILWHPAMSATRRTSGFKQLASDLGLVRHWRTSGNWPDACRPLTETDFECH